MESSLLKNYNANRGNKNNYSTQLNKLLNDHLARGHTKKVALEMFDEVELKKLK